jgi:hypothetical protein
MADACSMECVIIAAAFAVFFAALTTTIIIGLRKDSQHQKDRLRLG